MLHQFELIPYKTKIDNVVKRLLGFHYRILKDSFNEDLDLKEFLEKNETSRTILNNFMEKMNTILNQKNFTPKEVKATGKGITEVEAFLIAFGHMQATKGSSMINYLNINKPLAQFLIDNIGQLDWVAGRYEGLKRHKLNL